MTDDTERQLHAQFQALRRAVGAGAPDFAVAIGGLARQRERAAAQRRRVWRVGLAVAAAIALVTAVRRGRTPTARVSLAAAHWIAPTDFLLETPGAELLRTLPTLITEGSLSP